MNLDKKIVLITGGGTGIGRATAARFASFGATVWILGRQEKNLIETQKLIGNSCHYSVCDVTDDKALSKTINRLERLDIVVSNAAISATSALEHPRISEWRKIVEINQWGATNTCLLGGERMIRDKTSGRIVIVTSILGKLAERGSCAYGMSKAALNQMTRQLAVEWAQHNILVNAVDPGAVLTPMSYVSGENEYDSEWFHNFYIHPDRPRIPLQRPGTPEEIAEAILFLSNPLNTYCTGHILTIDGGLTASF